MTVGPMAASVPAQADIEAVPCPVERARRIGSIARQFGTLPGWLYRMRQKALLEARRTTAVVDLAAQVQLSPARVSQLTSPVATEGATP